MAKMVKLNQLKGVIMASNVNIHTPSGKVTRYSPFDKEVGEYECEEDISKLFEKYGNRSVSEISIDRSGVFSIRVI